MSNNILISRTDAIGDVVLTLPMCGILKKFHSCTIYFLGNNYTKDIITACKHVDGFINYDSWAELSDKDAGKELSKLKIDVIVHVFPRKRISIIAKKAGIKIRIGTKNRLFHWFNCNRLVSLSRKNSDLHEAQLNVKLLEALKLNSNYKLNELSKFYGLKTDGESVGEHSLLSLTKFNLLIHPKSRGSAVEWDLNYYTNLIQLLDPDKFKIFITGTRNEKKLLSEWIDMQGDLVTDITGKFSLKEFLDFISKADGLLACSTGPLHIAAASGIFTLGLYTNIRPIYAKRWSPVGDRAEFIESQEDNINSISPEMVATRILNWIK